MTVLASRLQRALPDRYRIERELGEGGMATVFLAEDLKHRRQVALKVLKPELAAMVGADRFLAEIRTTANLQHPHILPLHDSGEADGLLFYVMPYVPGESLRARLDREHQLPVEEAVRIATDAAEALDYAHRQGVVHRDIKPGNILLHDGRPLIADFGIALALGAAGGGRLTETGLSLGTPHYMSPEQATGEEWVGPATDIYALGCVLYEMLVGQPPFTGSTPQAVLGHILTGEAPSASRERALVPAHVDAAIRRALEKIPADRFPRAVDMARALGDPGFRHGSEGGSEVEPSSGWKGIALLSGAAAVLLTLWTLGSRDDATSERGNAYHGAIPLPVEQGVGPDLLFNVSPRIAIAPDGESFVYAGLIQGDESLDSRLYRRRFDQLVSQPIAGTEGGSSPFFSPDGAWLGFHRIGALMKVPAEGGTPLTITEVGSTGMWAAWWEVNDSVYFRPSGPNPGLWRVHEAGGPPSPVEPAPPASPFYRPLPDRRGILLQMEQDGADWIGVWDAEGEIKPVVEAASARYANGHLVAWRAPATPSSTGTLIAVPFDLDRLEATGPATPILEGDIANAIRGGYWASDDGTLVYLQGGTTTRSLVWLDRNGVEETICPGVEAEDAVVSSDGRSLAVASSPGIAILDAEDCTLQVLSEDGRAPSWLPDDRSVSFSAPPGIRSRRVDGSGSDSVLVRTGGPSRVAWSPDGRMLFTDTRPRSTGDSERAAFGTAIVLLQAGPGISDPVVLSDPTTLTTLPSVSPDGGWVATGDWGGLRRDIHVARLSDDGLVEERRVASDGAYAPVWSDRGDEIFFRRGSAVVSLPVETDPTFRVTGAERTLFIGPYLRTSPTVSPVLDYDPGRDRFLMIREANVPPAVRFVLNWDSVVR